MRINRLQAQNILAIKDIDIKITAPILLVAAANGAGKSSLADVIRMALTRQAPRGITQKKDWSMLLNDAALKAGGAVISCDNNHDQVFSFALPKGSFDGPDLDDAMKVALDGARFLSMTPAERRTFLFALTKRRASTGEIKKRLLAAGCDAAKVDEVMPTLLTGFVDGHGYAADRAKEAKALWRNTTGGTWGSVLGEKWAAPVPDMPAADVEGLRQTIKDLDNAIAIQTQALGAIQQSQRQAAADAARRVELAASAKRVPDLETMVPAAIAERDDYRAQVEALRARAKGAQRVGLVHDLARFVSAVNPIDDAQAAQQRDLLLAYAKEHGQIGAAGAADPEAVASLPEHERGLQVLTNKAANLERDLAAARVAKGEFDALASADDALDVTAELAEVQRLLEEARTARGKAASDLANAESVLAKRVDADQKTKDAKAHHDTVMAWLAIADQLAPGGIPAQLLKEALAPVNEALAQAAADAEWPLVQISDDMEVTVTRDKPLPYQLESKSYQWRANAMIAQVVAETSGLKLMLLDEADILEPAARPDLFSWLDMLVSQGIIDTVVLCATLKAPPANLLDTFQLAWVTYGGVAGAAQQAAA